MKWFAQPPPYKEQIWVILNRFDFQRVAEAMEQMGWKWGIGLEAEVPKARKLEETAEYLLRLVTQAEEPTMEAATGGFRAFYSEPPTWYRRGTLGLAFEVESYVYGEEGD